MTLCSLTLNLRAVELIGHEAGWTGHRVQGWFLDWVRMRDPTLATKLHDTEGRKPYTVSPLSEMDGKIQLRVTSLEAELSDLLMGTLTTFDTTLQIGRQAFAVESHAIRTSSFEQLVREATDSVPNLGLRFESPTSFHSNRLDVPLPLPALVFGSLIHAWDRFSPLPLPVRLGDVVRDQVALAQCQIYTRRVTIPQHGSHVGFIGRAQFAIRAPESEPNRVLIGALLGYAHYAGVGLRTTAGMGQAIPLGLANRA